MLRIVISRLGRRVAAAIAFVYLAGVIAPSLALALTNGAISAYCFDEIASEVAALHVPAQPNQAGAPVHVHVHADGTVHYHADHSKPAEHDQEQGKGQPHQGESHDANCCGAYGFTAVLPVLSGVSPESRALPARFIILSDSWAGSGPARIDRPPILLVAM